MNDKEQEILAALSYLENLEREGVGANRFFAKRDGIEVSPEFLRDAEFIKRAVVLYPGITYFMAQELRADHEFVYELYNYHLPCCPGLVLPLGDEADIYYPDYEEELRTRAEKQRFTKGSGTPAKPSKRQLSKI